ncbi:LysE family transporter [Candidatus Peregrinibacteria bacterium]|nr:LysE family transporter [Candidatus Peregrinibacteria bacterium]
MSLIDFLILGLIAGISPGPITALMLGETFKNGFREGAKVPIALIFSNLIIAPLSVMLLMYGAEIEGFLNIISYAGAILLIYMGYQEWTSTGMLEYKKSSHPIRTAFIADMINPYPYVFWFTVLAPSVILGIRESGNLRGLIFWTLFVCGLVGTKLAIVLIAAKGKKYLKADMIRKISKLLALALFAYGIKLLIH